MSTRISRSEFRAWRLFWLILHLSLFVGMYIFALDLGYFGTQIVYPEQALYLLWIWPTALVYGLTAWLLPNWLAMWLGFGVTMYLYYRWAQKRNKFD